MKVAFHFDSDHEDLGGTYYGSPARRFVFSTLLDQHHVHIATKVFVGDVLLKGHGSRSRTDIVAAWLRSHQWNRLLTDRMPAPFQLNVFSVCIESIDQSTAELLHDALVRKTLAYVGAVEVDDSTLLHRQLYRLCPMFRINGRSARVFWDGTTEDQKDPGDLEEVRNLGFAPVSWESLGGRYSIFDAHHTSGHHKRIAEFKRDGGRLLAFVADSVVTNLGDAIPDLGDQLWSALRSFEQAETKEQLSQVAATCRRIIEHVADRLFPPKEGVADGRPKLRQKNYRNRLLAFAEQAARSSTEGAFVCTSLTALEEQITKLIDVTNKGIHAEICRAETRRCLLRTILLLDDLVALKGSFQIDWTLASPEGRRA